MRILKAWNSGLSTLGYLRTFLGFPVINLGECVFRSSSSTRTSSPDQPGRESTRSLRSVSSPSHFCFHNYFLPHYKWMTFLIHVQHLKNIKKFPGAKPRDSLGKPGSRGKVSWGVGLYFNQEETHGKAFTLSHPLSPTSLHLRIRIQKYWKVGTVLCLFELQTEDWLPFWQGVKAD